MSLLAGAAPDIAPRAAAAPPTTTAASANPTPLPIIAVRGATQAATMSTTRAVGATGAVSLSIVTLLITNSIWRNTRRVSRIGPLIRTRLLRGIVRLCLRSSGRRRAGFTMRIGRLFIHVIMISSSSRIGTSLYMKKTGVIIVGMRCRHRATTCASLAAV